MGTATVLVTAVAFATAQARLDRFRASWRSSRRVGITRELYRPYRHLERTDG